MYDVSNINTEVKASLAVDTAGVVKPLGLAGTAFDRTHKKMIEVMRTTHKMTANFDYLVLSLKRIATYSAIFTGFTALASVMKNVVDLEYRLAEVSTLIDTRIQANAESFDRVKQELMSMNVYMGSTVELTKGLYEIMSAGVGDTSEAVKLLKVSAEYAKGGLTELGTAAASLTSIMKAYHLEADDMREISDQLFVSVQEGKYHVDELNGALGKILPTAAAMGVGIDEIVSALAAMSQQGMDANQSATALNRMLISFLRPIDKAKTWFQKLGWEWGINAFQARSFTERMQDLRNVTMRYHGILPEIFRRQRALRGAFVLTGKGLEDYLRILGKMDEATEGAGVTHRAFMKVTKTLKEEVSAFSVRINQAAQGMMDSTGAVSSLVNVLGHLSATVIKNIDQIGVLVGIFMLVSRASKFAALGWARATSASQALTASIYAQNVQMQAAVATSQAAAARAAVMSRMFSLGARAAMVAIPIYIAAKSAIDAWTKSIEEEMAAEQERNRLFFESVEEYRRVAAVVKEVTGEEVKLASTVKLMTERYSELRQEFIEFINKTKGGDIEVATAKMTLALGYVSQEAIKMRREIEAALRAYLNGIATQEQITLLAQVAKELGFMNKIMDMQVDEWMELEGVASVIEKRFRAVIRRTDMLSKAFSSLGMTVAEMKETMTYDEIKEMDTFLRNLDTYLSGSSKEAEALRSAFTRFAKEVGRSFEGGKRALAEFLKGIVETALAQKRQHDMQQRINDNMRSFVVLAKEASMPTQDLIEYAKGLVSALNELGAPSSYGQFKEWILALKGPLETVQGRVGELGPALRKEIEIMLKYLEKFKESGEDLAEKFEKVLDKIKKDIITHEAETESLLAEVRGERWNQIVIETQKEIDLLKQKYEEILKAEKWTAEQREQIRLEYYNLMEVMNKKMLAAEKVAQNRLLEMYKARADKLLRAEKRGSEERKRLYDKMWGEILSYLIFFSDATIDTMVRMYGHWKHITEGAMTDMENAFRGFANVFGRFIGDVLDMTSPFEDSFKDLFEGILRTAQEVIGRELVRVFEKAFKKIATESGASAGGVSSAIVMFASIVLQAINAMRKETEEEIDSLEDRIDQLLDRIDEFGSEAGASLSVTVGIWKALEDGTIGAAKALEYWLEIFEAYLEAGDLTNALIQTEQIFKAIEEGLLTAADAIGTLSDMIQDLFEEGFTEEAWGYVDEILQMIEDGTLDAADAVEDLGEMFESMLDAGQEGTAEMVNFITELRRLGVTVQEVDDYVFGWLERAAEGLLAMATGYTLAEQELLELIEAQEEFGCASEQYQDLQREIDILRSKIGPELRDELDRTSRLMLATFSAFIAQGGSFIDALDMIEEAVAALQQRYEMLGWEGSEAFKELAELIGIKQQHEALFEAIQGNVEVLQALGNTGFLTQEILNDVADQAVNYYNRLIDSGVDADTALRIMGSTLSSLQYYANEFGLTLDENTQSLIEQADAAGVLGDVSLSQSDIMKAGFEGLQDILVIIAEALGATVPGALRSMAWEADEQVGSARGQMEGYGEAIDIVGGKIREGLPGAGDDMVKALSEDFALLEGSCGDFAERLNDAKDIMKNDLINAGESMKNKVRDDFADITDGVLVFNKSLRTAKDQMSALEGFNFNVGAQGILPSYKTGATDISSGGLALLHRGEAVLPEEISEALRAFFGRQTAPPVSGEGDGSVIEVHLDVEGETLYKVLVPHLRKGGRFGDYEVSGEGVF